VTIEFAPAARDEIREAHRWYADRDPNVAQRFIDAVDAALHDAAEWPLAGSPWMGDSRLRLVRVHGFPYRLAYEVTADGLWLLACAHERRRPGWTDRG
jgi:plasmid stabilization system protein ParE